MTDPRLSEDIHPQLSALIEARAAARENRVLDAEILREQTAAGVEIVNAGSPPIAERREIPIPRRRSAGSVRTVLFRPEHEGPLGLCIYFPGGGFVICNPETHEKVTRVIANAAPAIVVSVDYRKAPEEPFPAAREDAIEAVDWLMDMRGTLGAELDSVVLAGDSSGANLAVGVTQHRIGNGQPVPHGLLLLYPWLDMGRDSESRRRFGPDDFLIDDEYMDFLTRCYLPDGRVDDPKASPIYGDFTGFPPTAVICGTRDPLYSDSERIVQQLREASAEVDWRPFEGMPHGFVSMNNHLDPGAEALHLASKLVGRLLLQRSASRG